MMRMYVWRVRYGQEKKKGRQDKECDYTDLSEG
jgi:hypothetical protein